MKLMHDFFPLSFMSQPQNVGRRTFPKESLWHIVGGTMEILEPTIVANIKSGFAVTGIYPTDEQRLLDRESKIVAF
jgi:hypothetical protein